MSYRTDPFPAPRASRAPLIISCVTAGVVLLVGVVAATLYFSRPAAPGPAVQASPAAATTSTTPSPQTQYVMPPAPVYVAPPQTQYVPYTQYVSPPSYSSSSDADFLSRMRARDIVTPGDAAEISGARAVCSGLSAGGSIHDEANALMDPPYDYPAPLAGYFAGEAVKVYCPRFSGQLTG